MLCILCMLSHFSHVQLFPTPWTVTHQTPLSMGFSRQEYWSGLPFPPPGGPSQPRDRTCISCFAGGFFTTEPQVKPQMLCIMCTISSVQSLSCVWFFATPWIEACQASLSITNSRSPPKPMSIESVMPSNHLILCRPLLLLPSVFPSIRVFSNELVLRIRWPK